MHYIRCILNRTVILAAPIEELMVFFRFSFFRMQLRVSSTFMPAYRQDLKGNGATNFQTKKDKKVLQRNLEFYVISIILHLPFSPFSKLIYFVLIRIGIRSQDLEDSLEKFIKGSSLALSSPRLVIPAVIYLLWGISQHFTKDFFDFQVLFTAPNFLFPVLNLHSCNYSLISIMLQKIIPIMLLFYIFTPYIISPGFTFNSLYQQW